MAIKYYQTVPRKKDKTDVLEKHKGFKKYVLDTRILSVEALKDMMRKYDMVVFKPNIGGGGKHVGFVEKTSDGFFSVQRSKNIYHFKGVNLLHDYIKNINLESQFILQKGVRLITYKGSPIDVRVSVQKVHHAWSVTGIVAKIAADGKKITNKSSGGKGINFEKLFNALNVPLVKQNLIRREIYHLCLNAARALNKTYKGLRELGFDLGFDQNFDIYIIEINTKPRYNLFKQAGDIDTFKRIDRNHSAILASIDEYKREL
jgi:hypothetical protein